MHKAITTSRRNLALFSLILAGESAFFLPFILARIFRPTLLQVFEITNTELGSYFSLYGVVAIVSYLLGGPLADRFPSRYLLSSALWLTSLGGLVMWFAPFKNVLFALYGFWGMTTILLFWAALIRATREWGGANLQGRAFGWLESGRGASAALLGTLALLVFSDFNPQSSLEVNINTERITAFRHVILCTSLFTMFSGVLIWIFVPLNKATISNNRIKFKRIATLLKMPSIWLLSVIIICGYVGYKVTDNFSLYANEVLGFNEVHAAGFGTGTLWMRAVIAVGLGYLSDKVISSRIITFCFACTVIAGSMLALGLFESRFMLVMLNFLVVLVGIYGVRALYFALIQEGRTPILLTGTAVGIISIIGYTPDVFMSPWMGYLLDNNPGVEGHRHVFWVLTSFAMVGFIASIGFTRLTRTKY